MDTGWMRQQRAQALGAVSGRVLEIGFGSGLNLPHYPRSGVESLTAVEPNGTAIRIARGRIDAAPFPVETIGLRGEEIPCDDDSFDVVVSTFTLCTIPDVEAALAQVRRVLKPGGRFLFLEHGHAPDPGVERWQRRLEPTQRRLFGGCHLTRRIDALVAGAGFEVSGLDRYYGKGPKPLVSIYRGVGVAQ